MLQSEISAASSVISDRPLRCIFPALCLALDRTRTVVLILV
jgi:hypothetical protein